MWLSLPRLALEATRFFIPTDTPAPGSQRGRTGRRSAAWPGRAGKHDDRGREGGGGGRGALGGRAARAAHLERPGRSSPHAPLRAGLAGRSRACCTWRACRPAACSTSGSSAPARRRSALVPALRAYLVSHLGKYVPGKAMVVVMRSGMVVPFGRGRRRRRSRRSTRPW